MRYALVLRLMQREWPVVATEHREWHVPHLVSVTVRAVQNVDAPLFPQAGDLGELAAHQRSDGPHAGSWDPIGVWDGISVWPASSPPL